MRRILVAGNWKMFLTFDAARTLAREVVERTRDLDARVDVAIFPSYPYLPAVAEAAKGSRVAVGGQDLYWENEGAFTGAVSAPMLASVGCRMALVGHSERRHVFGESDAETNKKVQASLNHDLKPVLCVGEKLEEREANRTEEVLERQIGAGLEGVSRDDLRRIVLAYEPVWAIGTGRTATPETAQAAHAFLRAWIGRKYGPEAADRVQILYGGSVKPDNAEALMSQPDLDGVLVGGASLKADGFAAIARASQPIT